jgi:hypothetical protein
MNEFQKAQLTSLGLQLQHAAGLEGPALGRALARVRFDVAALIKDLGFTRKRAVEAETEEDVTEEAPPTTGKNRRKSR